MFQQVRAEMSTTHRKNGTFRKGHSIRQKGDRPADGHLHIRVPMETKGRWVETSRAAGLPLSEWVTRVLDDASKHRPKMSWIAQKDERGNTIYSLVAENFLGRRWILLRTRNGDDRQNLLPNSEALRLRLENPTDEDLKMRIQNPADGCAPA